MCVFDLLTTFHECNPSAQNDYHSKSHIKLMYENLAQMPRCVFIDLLSRRMLVTMEPSWKRRPEKRKALPRAGRPDTVWKWSGGHLMDCLLSRAGVIHAIRLIKLTLSTHNHVWIMKYALLQLRCFTMPMLIHKLLIECGECAVTHKIAMVADLYMYVSVLAACRQHFVWVVCDLNLES